MKKDTKIKKATELRKRGFSFREISEKLHIAKSTTSLWLRNIEISQLGKKRISKLGDDGRKKGIKTNLRRRSLESSDIQLKVKKYFSGISYSKFNPKIACALLYWGEGTKYIGNKAVSFTNADPEMIKFFLNTFRKSFDLDESRFRALIHLHEYHNVKKQTNFWSSITKIPETQFNKSYLKKNTGKNKKKDYPGCISIRYSDIKIYKELMFILKELKDIELLRAW